VRIDRIDLIRFGHFASRAIELPPTKPDYYLIYGDNEVGKSTLLRGISALFFGVPGRPPDVHSCKASELRIGATISDHEKSFSFRRRKGTSGTLLNVDEAQIQDAALSPFLRELDRERFEQFFGLNHQRLREGGEGSAPLSPPEMKEWNAGTKNHSRPAPTSAGEGKRPSSVTRERIQCCRSYQRKIDRVWIGNHAGE
jgi:uncharacterized protein YhaN